MKDELLKQWQKDVEDYGDNAYLMYEYYIDNTKTYKGYFENNIEINDSVFELLVRKQSSELPFDLERTKEGDDVQAIDNWSFENQKQLIDVILHRVNGDLCYRPVNYQGVDWFICDSVYSKDLRMKFPPKVKK